MFELNRLYNMDCMAAMQEIPDKFFELAICDPPYGIGIDGQKLNINKKIPRCDAVMVGVRHGISAGMKAEIDFARRCGVPVQYIQE